MAGLLSRAFSAFRALAFTEGKYREGPYYLSHSGGWLSSEAGRHWNWWQNGYSIEEGGRTAMVEACVASYAQTVAMCPGSHWVLNADGGRTRQTTNTSALARVIRKPNSYQSISDFLLNLVYGIYSGNGYILIERNNRFEPAALHLFPDRTSYAVVSEDGEVFYRLQGNEVVEKALNVKSLIVPARDVIHIRMHTPRHPLVGESPLVAAGLQMAAADTALQQQILFHANQSRPSFVLTTDQTLKRQQVQELRQLWEEQAKGLSTGGTPILTAGLKAQPLSVAAKDSQIAELLKLSDQAIANVMRIPLAVLGLGQNTFANTEALMQFWLASGLGFLLNHIEEGVGNAFNLKGQPEEYLELDTSALQRSSFKDRVEAWAAGTTGGIFARNEARQDFEKPKVDGGDEPWVQQQDIPLSIAYEQAKNPPPPPAPPAPDPGVDDEPTPGSEEEPDEEAQAAFLADLRRHLTENLDAA